MLFRLPYPVSTARTIIIPHYGLCSTGNSSQRHGNNQHKALHNGIAGKEHAASLWSPIAAYNHVHDNDEQAVRGNDQKRGQAHQKHLLHGFPPVPAKSNPHQGTLAEQKQQHIGTGGHL